MDLVKNDNIFRGVSDRFNGLTIDSSAEPCSSDNFLNKLNGTLIL